MIRVPFPPGWNFESTENREQLVDYWIFESLLQTTIATPDATPQKILLEFLHIHLYSLRADLKIRSRCDRNGSYYTNG
jgi:hypothetical protein